MIQVLVVEDDPVAAEAHRLYVTRVDGFAVAGVVQYVLKRFTDHGIAQREPRYGQVGRPELRYQSATSWTKNL